MGQEDYTPTEKEVDAALGGYEEAEINEAVELHKQKGWEVDKIVKEFDINEKVIPPGIEYRVVGAGRKLVIFKRPIGK